MFSKKSLVSPRLQMRELNKKQDQQSESLAKQHDRVLRIKCSKAKKNVKALLPPSRRTRYQTRRGKDNDVPDNTLTNSYQRASSSNEVKEETIDPPATEKIIQDKSSIVDISTDSQNIKRPRILRQAKELLQDDIVNVVNIEDLSDTPPMTDKTVVVRRKGRPRKVLPIEESPIFHPTQPESSESVPPLIRTKSLSDNDNSMEDIENTQNCAKITLSRRNSEVSVHSLVSSFHINENILNEECIILEHVINDNFKAPMTENEKTELQEILETCAKTEDIDDNQKIINNISEDTRDVSSGVVTCDVSSGVVT